MSVYHRVRPGLPRPKACETSCLLRLAKWLNARYGHTKHENVARISKGRDGAMIHPSLIAIAAIVVVFGILNLIEYKRLD